MSANVSVAIARRAGSRSVRLISMIGFVLICVLPALCLMSGYVTSGVVWA